MTTLFDLTIWETLREFAKPVTYSRKHNLLRLEFALPQELLAPALAVVTNCVACGEPTNPVRLRHVRSERSRVADSAAAKRAFYAAACITDANPGCQRTKAARAHMQRVRIMLGGKLVPDDPIAQVEAYRKLCNQLCGALNKRRDFQLADWLKRRCRNIERQTA